MSASGATTDDTDTCGQCKTFRDRSAEPFLFVVHTKRDVFSAGKKSPFASKKKKTLNKLERIVSALRNSEGGQVVIHIEGQEDGDRYLEHFDEFITGSFSDLIEDGQLYVEAYERQWLSAVEDFEDCQNFVLINVGKSTGITTVDFNTKVNNDIENKNPSPLNIAGILFKVPQENSVAPRIRGLPDVQLLHENRSIEIKSLKGQTLGESPSELVDYIWNNLKLKDNLTSMSKVIGGGSYYVGISEVTRKTSAYKTKTPQIDGFPLRNTGALTEGIQKKIKDCVLVLKDRTFTHAPGDLIKIRFHHLPRTFPQKHVLEVAVRYFEGVVFYDKQGPRTYGIQDNTIKRLDKDEWLTRFVERFESCVRQTS